MKRFLLIAGFLSVFAIPVHAGVVKVGVNGMVCDFCARAIEKVFTRHEAVQAVDVNLDDKLITVDLKDGQSLDDEAITKMVNDSGYALVDITREAEDE